MSFCYLLNALLLFTAVLAFIIAGFASTFLRRLSGCRYRLMLSPLGFVVLGSLARSITRNLMRWFLHPAALHPAVQPGVFTMGTGSEIFQSVILILAGISGILAGVSLGAALDRVPSAEQTYTIANYWRRLSRNSSIAMPKEPQGPRPTKATVIPISDRRGQPGKQAGKVHRINAVSENE